MKNHCYMGLLWLITFISIQSALEAQVVCTYTAPNDLCQNAFQLSSLSLSSSTCCGNIEGVSLCPNAQTGVWYYYDQSGAASLVSIENMSISGGISVEFYQGTCNALTLIQKSDCSGFMTRDFEVPNCDGRIFIHISSTKNGCGEFNISATDVNGCDFADLCQDIGPAQTLLPVADDVQVCASSCLNYSCVSTCTDESVWFRFDTDDLTTAVQIVIDNPEFDPLISVYRGTNCIDFDDLLLCDQVNPGEFIDLSVTPDFTYFIEVSLESGTPGAFELCINAIQDYIECSSGTITAFRPENPSGNPNGPYCPGETILFCYDMEFYVDTPAEGNGCQWLQGIVPVVGGGWDLSVNNLENQNPINWLWFDDVDYNVDSPVLALGADSKGNKILEYGPGGMKAGDILPGGWYFVSNGTNAGCTNDGHPDNMWGVNTPCGSVFNFSHCFELTTRSVNDIQDCDDEYIKDLSVTLFNFADGETGCYTSLACSGDTPVKFDAVLDCSNLVNIMATGDVICSDEFAEIPIGIEGDYEIPLIVEVIDAGNTTGAQDWVFETGSGLIPDQITNLGNSIETIRYRVSFYQPESDCNPPTVEFDVLVYPEFSFTIPDYHEICLGETQSLTAPSGHDSYKWYDAETNEYLSDQRQIITDSSGYYRIEIEEGFCQSSEIVQVVVNDPLPLGIAVEEITVCNNYIGTLDTELDLTQYQLNGVQGSWFNEFGIVISDPADMDFDGETPSSFLYEFRTSNAQWPCPDTIYEIQITVEDCKCPDLQVIAPSDFCALSQVFDLANITATVEDGTWRIVDGPVGGFIEISNNELVIRPNTVEGEYSLMFELTDNNVAPLCSRDTVVQFNVFRTPTADVIPSGNVCNIYTGTLDDFIDLDDYLTSTTSGVWTSDNSSIFVESDNTVDFLNVVPGQYIFYFTTDEANFPCQDQQYSTTITVEDCSCPDVTILNLDDQCIDELEFDLTSLEITSEEGIWSVVSGADINSVELNGDILRIDENTREGEYTLRYSLTDSNIGPLCQNSSEISFSLNAPVEVTIIPVLELCNEYTGTLGTSFDLDDLITTSNSGSWTSDIGSIFIDSDNIVEFEGVDPGEYIFRYVTDDAMAPCQNKEYFATVQISDCTCPDVSILPLGDQCIDDFEIDLSSLEITSEDGEWSVSSGADLNSVELVGDILRISSSSVQGEYILRYTLSDVFIGPLCDLYSEISFVLNSPASADLMPMVDVCNEYTGTLETSVDLDDLITTSNNGVWSSVNGLLFINGDNQVDLTGTDPGEYEFMFVTNDVLAPCQNEQYFTTVRVLDCTCPDVRISPLGDQCIDDLDIDLTALEVTTEDGEWSLVSGADLGSVELNGDVLTIDVNSMQGEYTLRYTLSSGSIGPLCPAFSEISFILNSPVEAVVIPSIDICNEYTGTLETSVDLDDMITTVNSGSWTSNNAMLIIEADNRVELEGVNPGLYEFYYRTDDAVAPCQDEEYTVTINVTDCTCPDVRILPLGDQCIDDLEINLSALELTSEEGSWSVESGSDINSVELNGDILRIQANSVQGEYILRYSLSTSQIGPLCDAYSEISFMLNSPVVAQVIPMLEVCNEFTGTLETSLDLDDMITTLNSGSWTSNDASISIDGDNKVELAGNDPGDYEFRFTTNDAVQPCQNEEYSITIRVMDCTCPNVELVPLGDQCIEFLEINLDELYVSGASGVWTLVSGPDLSLVDLLDSKLTIDENASDGEYVLRYTIDDSGYGPLCDLESDLNFHLYNEPEADIIPSGQACNEDTGTFADWIDLDDYQLSGSSGDWTSLDPNLIIDADNVVSFLGMPTQNYMFTFQTNTANAPCQDQQYQLEVELLDCSCPNLEIDQLGSFCIQNTSVDLQDYLITQESGTWSIESGVNIASIALMGDRLEITESSVSGLYTLRFDLSRTDIGPDCPMSAFVDFQLIDKPVADIVPQVIACNENTGAEPDVLDLDDFNKSNTLGEWRSENSSLSIDGDNRVVFTGVEPGPYEFSFTTQTAIAPCDEEQYIMTVNVRDCSCPAMVVMPPDNFCQDEQIYELNNLIIESDPGEWTLSAGLGSVPVLSGSQLIIEENTLPGQYLLSYSLIDQNIPPDCEVSIDFPFEIIEEPMAEVIPTFEVCDAFIGSLPVDLDLDDLFISGDAGIWTSSNASIAIDAENRVNFEGLEPDVYDFYYTTTTAELPCVDAEYLVQINVTKCECPVLELAEIPTLCKEDEFLNLSDYLVSDQSGFWSVEPNPNSSYFDISANRIEFLDDLPAGPYVLTYQFSDTNLPSLCKFEESVQFDINVSPVIEITTSFLACNSEDSGFAPMSLNLNDFVSGSSGSWLALDNRTTPENDGTVSFEDIEPGEYTFEFTTDSAVEPCQDITESLVVTVEDCLCPIIAFIPASDLCNEEEFIDLDDFILNGTAEGVWMQISGDDDLNYREGEDIDLSGVAEGIYQFEYTLAQQVPIGCENVDTFSFNVISSVQVDVIENIEVCNQYSSIADECIDLTTMVSGSQGEWLAPSNYTNDFSDITKVCFDGYSEGEQFVFTFKSQSAVDPCKDKEGELEVLVMDCSCPILDLEPASPICNQDGTINLNSYKTSSTVDGSWQFISGAETIILNGSSFDVSGLSSGEYNFEFVPTDEPAASCPQTSALQIQIEEYHFAGIGNSIAYCEGEDILVDLYSLLDNEYEIGRWVDVSSEEVEESFDSEAGELMVKDLIPGTYRFEYTVESNDPCPASSAVAEIIIVELPIADAGEDRILTCEEDIWELGGDGSTQGANVIYIWRDLSDNNNIVSGQSIFSIGRAGTFELEVRNTMTGCVTYDQVVVTDEIGMVSFDVEVSQFDCANPNTGSITVLNSQGGDGDYLYSLDNGLNWTAETVFPNLSPGNYSILMQDGNLCEYELRNIKISSPVHLNVSAGEDLEIEYGDELITLELWTDASDEEIFSIIWEEDGEIICQGGVEDCYVIQVDPFQLNAYCVTVTDTNGCEDSDCIVIEEILEVNVYIPNVFRPASYTNNDMFFVQTNDNVVSVNTFRVLDRWGGIVFERIDKHNPNEEKEGWDGTWKQKDVMPGVYTYHVLVEDVFGELHSFVGDITLLR